MAKKNKGKRKNSNKSWGSPTKSSKGKKLLNVGKIIKF